MDSTDFEVLKACDAWLRLDMSTGEVRLDSASPGMTMRVSNNAFTTIHGPRQRLLIIGAGQMSGFLAQIAAGMDYQVTVGSKTLAENAISILAEMTATKNGVALPGALRIDAAKDMAQFLLPDNL